MDLLIGFEEGGCGLGNGDGSVVQFSGLAELHQGNLGFLQLVKGLGSGSPPPLMLSSWMLSQSPIMKRKVSLCFFRSAVSKTLDLGEALALGLAGVAGAFQNSGP